MPDFSIELTGTPEDVLKMRNVASRIEGATAYREKRVNDGHYTVWYRASEAPNDLLAAIKRKAGLVKSKSRKARKETKMSRGKEDLFQHVDIIGGDDASTDSPKA